MKPTRSRRQAVRRIRRRLDKSGLLERAAAVEAVAKRPEFSSRFNAMLTAEGREWIKDYHHARQLAEAVLDEMMVDRRDVALTFAGDPAKRRLEIFVRPAHAAVQELAKVAKLRAVEPSATPKP